MADFILSEQYIFGLLESSDLFPIDFDEAWRWVEYSRKDNAKRALEKNFTEGVDYQILKLEESVNHEGLSAQEKAYLLRTEQIKLTFDCFEHFCLMANTDKGRQVRQHFIECRRKYIAMLKQQSSQQQKLTPIQIIAALAQQMVEQEARVQQQQEQINTLLTIQREAREELAALPYSDKPAPEKTTRMKVNELVRNYCHRNSVPHKEVWAKLYREFRDRCHVDASIRAKNQSKLAIDVIDELGLIDELHAIATLLLK